MIDLLDTNAVSDLMRGHPALDLRLAGMSPEDRAITCTITRGELLFGLARLPAGRRRDELQKRLIDVLAALPCEPIPPTAAEHYADLKIIRQREGLPLDENDLWIAATAMHLGATLISRDKDLAAINGLAVQDWTT